MTVDADRPAGPAEALQPLGHRQRMIWAGQLLDPDVPLYNMAHAFTIEGPIDVDAFRAAFAALVDAHDALRIVIDERDGQPVQRILSTGDATVELVDLRGEADPTVAADAWVEARSRVPFDLGRRLHDSALLLVGDATTVWYLNQHHLICDAWSVSFLLGRQGELYQQCLDGALDGALDAAPEAPSYVDFLAREAERPGSKGWTRAQAHWQARLSEPPEPLTFYGLRPDEPGIETVRVEARIEGERARRLADFLERPEVAALSPELTAARFFHTVLVAYLHRICGVDRVVVGTPFHNRAKRADKRTAGLFMNLSPVVTEIEPGETMASLSAKVGAELFESLRHGADPPAAAMEDGAFEAVLNYLHVPNEHFGDRPVEDRWIHPGAGDRSHSLRLQVRRLDEGFRLFFDVKTALFDEPARRSLVDHVVAIIDGWMAAADGGATDTAVGGARDVAVGGASDVAVGDLPLLTAEEQEGLLVDFNRRSGPPVPTASVLDDIARVMGERADAVALRQGDTSVTYGELDRRSAAVATRLVDAGVGPNDLVGVLLPRSIDAVAAILAVLRVGAGYLPVEPSTPPDRLASMVADAEVGVICTDRGGAPAAEAAGARALVVTEVAAALGGADRPGWAPPGPDPLDRTAYVIFTSGSTGRPKGVPITHRGLANYVAWAAAVYTDGEPRSFALYTSLAFDLTITSLFVPLTTGGTIHIYGETADDPAGDGTPVVVDVFTDDEVDVVKATPSHLAIVRQLGLRAERLRTLIVGGEDFTTDLAAAIQDLHPRAAIHNEYGPTETVVGCMRHRYDRAADRDPSVPIGRPGANAEILLLDRWGSPVPPGVVGEIHIGGPGVAGRYLARPDISAERFVPRPEGLAATEAATPTLYRSGDLGRWRPGLVEPHLEFLGRADDQVKIRGHRIELGEIEAVLADQPGIESAAVLVVDESAGPAAAPADAGGDAVIHCERCGLPSNYPDATFEDGVCSLCRDYDTYRDKVDAYFRTPDELAAVAAQIRDRPRPPRPEGEATDEAGYDCLVLLSGGKDSTYMLYQVVALGLRPLVFTLDNGFISPSALANSRRVCDDLGVDLHVGRTEHMNEIFRDSLERFSNVCNGCFKTIYTLSMNLARSHGIDHIVTGLARGQLFETRLSDMYDRRIFDVDQIDRFVLEARKAYHQIDDAVSAHLDVSAFVDGRIYDEITFVDFYRYVDVALDEVMGFLADHTPWVRPEDTGRSTNCLINDVGIHVHQRERGFHNYALPYSWDVRLGHKERDAALDELDDDIDEDYVNEVMVQIGYRPEPPAERRTSRLVAHYQSPEPRDTDSLRRALAATLPDYMLPAGFVHHRQLPLTVNGKIDRAGLAATATAGVSGSAPDIGADLDRLTGDERDRLDRLASVWAWTFDRPVEPADNFFDLGGDSITAIQIVDRAATSGLALTPRQIFAAPTLLATALGAEPIDGQAAPDNGAVDPAVSDPAVSELAVSELAVSELAVSDPAVSGPLTIDDDDDRQVLSLTPTQRGMLFHTLAEPASGLYQGQIVHRLRGRVDVAVLRRSWEGLVDRHPTLRTVFRWEGVDEPVQAVGPARPELGFLDWSGAADGEARLDRYLAADRADRFELAAEPPVRAAVIATPDTWALVWSFHHIALDGWSIALAVNELLTSYQAAVDGRSWSPPGRRSFGRYLDHLGRADRARAERFWRRELAGFDRPTVLARSRPDPGPDRPGGRPYGAIEHRLDTTATEAVTGYAGRSRVTLSTVLQGAWALVLARHQGAETETEDVVYGVTTSGRPPDLAGAETMVGMLVTTLPARVHIDGEAAPVDWLRAIQDRQLAVRDHEYASLVDIQRWSDVPAAEPLFESILVVENFPDYRPPDDPEALAVVDRAYRVQSNYPLSLIVLPGPELVLKAVYDPDQFDADVVARLLDQVERALASLAADRSATVADVATIGDDELADLAAWADPAGAGVGTSDDAPEPEPDSESEPEPELVPARIDRWITERPTANAVVCGRRVLTYEELGRRADRIAAALTEAGVGPGSLVAVAAERSPELVAALVGVHRAGAGYVPLDPGYPADRLRFMLDDAGVAAVVATESGDDVVRSLIGPAIGSAADATDPVPIDDTGLVLRSWPSGPGSTSQPASATIPGPAGSDPAYLIYTSGSTGRPNGVLVDHANLAWSTAARIEAYDHQPEAFLLLSSFSFDSSVVGLFWTLATGGTLVLPEPGEELDVRALGRLIERWGVTHTLCLPSLHALLLEHGRRRSLVTLSTVIVAGEACPPAVVAAHRQALPGTQLHNEYGPTEATVWCTVGRVDEADGLDPTMRSVPIGRPAPGAVVAVLDGRGRPSGVGVPGEIHVGGPGLTAGYHRRPEMTEARFVTRDGRRWFRTGDVGVVDADGMLHFRGRLDGQVKIRGHRVELGEVEAALAAHPAVAEAAATIDAGSRLVAHVELAGSAPGAGERPDPAELRAWVADRLPDPFVPAAVAVAERLPRLPNGKVDRRGLVDVATAPAPSAGRPPTTGAERTIATIWADLLPGIDFGTDDDFFDVGGDSLLAVALVERVRRATGVELALSALLETPTVAALAERVAPAGPPLGSPAGPVAGSRSLVALRAEGGRVPLYLIPPAAGTALSFRELEAATDPDQPLYCFEPVGTYGEAEPHQTVEAMAEHYLAELALAQPDGRYRIGGSCLGAIVAWEMAQRLDRAGTPVELLVFLDPGPPHSGPGWSYELPSQRSPRQLVRTTWDTVTSGELLTAARAVWRRNSFDRIGRIHYRAQLRYVAERLDAPIIWLESEELARDRPDFLDQWRILAGDDLTPIVVPGTTHDGLMTGQRAEVRRLAQYFDRAMADVERSGRPPAT